MIYEHVETDTPLRQGDIFTSLPRVELSLKEIILVEEGGERLTNWQELSGKKEQVSIMVPIRPVAAIVATQDCDAVRSRDITLCEIRRFKEVEGKTKDAVTPKSWSKLITQHSRINQKWFYLPPDPDDWV